MQEIKAFVGHSFTEQDEAVVTTFLSYFDQMKAVLPAFDWVHARAAEPTELATKVMSLIEDRNVFIGICTKKERVVADANIRASLWSRDKMVISSADLQWKTSDWIIQEVGLAIGRKMAVVLLLENGCRKPGGLQGDVEFIPFERSAPEKAFGRLLEMMKALSPPSSAIEVTSREAQQEATNEAGPPPSTPDTDIPDETWDTQRYENAYAWNLIVDDPEAAEKIDESYRCSKEASDPVKLAEWESIKEVWRLQLEKGGSLSRLRALREKFPEDLEILLNFVGGLVVLGLNSEAAVGYLSAAELAASDTVERERLRGLAAIQMAKAGQRDKAAEILKDQRANILRSSKKEQLNYLNRMKEFTADSEEKYAEIEILERIVDLEPSDWDARFSLAYRYSQIGSNDLSLYHYLKIPASQRSPTSWNNLGVCFQQLSMPAKSVDAYRVAATKDETLAMSNLAYKLMGAGFIKEANEELQRAMQIKDFHRNVGEAIASLRDIPEEESKKISATLKATDARREFFRSLGQAIAHPDVESLPEGWHGPDCALSISIKNDVFHATGKYERSASALARSLAGELKPVKHTIEYRGKILGHRVMGTLQRKVDGNNPGSGVLSLMNPEEDIEFAMVIDRKNREISVAERPSSTSPRFYRLISEAAA